MNRSKTPLSYTLNSYVVKGFLTSFLVAFAFFFFIFFINQLLLFAQKVLIKSVRLDTVVKLITLSIPQILLYTLPFSTLTASAMLIGDLSANSEILALRSCGIALRKVFSPLVILALLLSFVTFFVADVMLPYSSYRFKSLYSEAMQQLPTLELDSYSVKKIGPKVVVTKLVDKGEVDSIVVFDNEQIISGEKGKLTLLDLNSYIYKLQLSFPKIVGFDSEDRANYEIGHADEVDFYLDFKSEVSSITDISLSQLSSRDLIKAIDIRKAEALETKERVENKIGKLKEELKGLSLEDKKRVNIENEISILETEQRTDFYLLYYQAELHKKFALSFSSLFLVFASFSLAFIKIKHGRLFGFGLSLVVSSLYWFLLFFAQLQIFDLPVHPALLLWTPNLIVFVLALSALIPTRRI